MRLTTNAKAQRISRFENNIMFASGVASAVSGNDCYLVNNVMSPQTGSVLGNIVMDPRFVDAPSGNFRLRPGSPAIGAASNALTIVSDHDYDGTARPQGAAPDIGAYEQ